MAVLPRAVIEGEEAMGRGEATVVVMDRLPTEEVDTAPQDVAGMAPGLTEGEHMVPEEVTPRPECEVVGLRLQATATVDMTVVPLRRMRTETMVLVDRIRRPRVVDRMK